MTRRLSSLILALCLSLIAVEAGAEPAGASPEAAAHQAAPEQVEAEARASGASSEPSFRCPGDSPEFWREVKEGGWVGYGETWDMKTCDQGREIFAEGATRRWKKMRPQLANGGLPNVMDEKDVEFYATVLPYGAFGSIGVIFVLAWLFALIQRRRQEPVEVVSCPSCAVEIPLRLDEGGVFCPACGSGVVIERDAGSAASA